MVFLRISIQFYLFKVVKNSPTYFSQTKNAKRCAEGILCKSTYFRFIQLADLQKSHVRRIESVVQVDILGERQHFLKKQIFCGLVIIFHESIEKQRWMLSVKLVLV